METEGKCEGCWVHHPPSSCEGKAFQGFNNKGTRKEIPKEKTEKKNKRDEENNNDKERKRN